MNHPHVVNVDTHSPDYRQAVGRPCAHILVPSLTSGIAVGTVIRQRMVGIG
jgi:hypothetical protein